MLVHSGPAKVFNSEEEAVEAITGGKIVKGDVVVIRYEGPKGGPGMREMLTPTSMIAGMGLDKDVALLTDGRSLVLLVVHPLVTYLQKLRQVVQLPLLKMGISSTSTFQTVNWN